ncbi:hypothetical protein CCH79_00007861, partial [Gambusia affinis]
NIRPLPARVDSALIELQGRRSVGRRKQLQWKAEGAPPILHNNKPYSPASTSEYTYPTYQYEFQSHTILLVQPTKRPEGRTYADYESVNECMEGVCKMYEEHLKRMNPNSPSITYDISQLFDFIDDLADLSCLVYRADTQTYQPYNKDWIKEKIYVLLRRQAQQAAK